MRLFPSYPCRRFRYRPTWPTRLVRAQIRRCGSRISRPRRGLAAHVPPSMRRPQNPRCGRGRGGRSASLSLTRAQREALLFFSSLTRSRAAARSDRLTACAPCGGSGVRCQWEVRLERAGCCSVVLLFPSFPRSFPCGIESTTTTTPSSSARRAKKAPSEFRASLRRALTLLFDQRAAVSTVGCLCRLA